MSHLCLNFRNFGRLYSTEESSLLNFRNFGRPYSTEESSLLKRKVENELLSGRGPGFVVIRLTAIWS